MTQHLTFDEISDLAEREGGDVPAHVRECAPCRDEIARVRVLLASAHALPRNEMPPAEVWQGVRARMRATPRPAKSSPSPLASRRWWHNGWLASAAALVLIAGTATFTVLMSNGRATRAKALPVTTAPAAQALLAVDKNYVSTIRDLRATLEAQRPTLAPATIQVVERSLAVIDAAIAEARTALAADPANQALIDILASHYERQVDLLQRATELSPTT